MQRLYRFQLMRPRTCTVSGELTSDRKSDVGRLDKAWDEATVKGWIVLSMKDDWKTIFPPNGTKE
jgi:hypothetical protein